MMHNTALKSAPFGRWTAQKCAPFYLGCYAPMNPASLSLKSRHARRAVGWLAQFCKYLGSFNKATPPAPPLPVFEDEATLYSLASEYFEAATVLSNTPPMRIGYTMVTYYLAGHAAELVLKSFLFKHGETIESLAKRYGHDLKLLVKHARLKGLPVSISTEHIQDFAKTYTSKHTEYRRKHLVKLPPLDLLLLEIESLRSHAFDRVAEF